MKAYVTSIGEPTTDLCCEQLERYGYEVELIQGESSLWTKLVRIYEQATGDFIRVDADVVPNRHVATFWEHLDPAMVWLQASHFDWYSQEAGYGGVQYVRKEALAVLRTEIIPFEKASRPESQMFRLDPFHDPRICKSTSQIVGLHGYGQPDLDRVKRLKEERKQYHYDWQLVEKLRALCG